MIGVDARGRGLGLGFAVLGSSLAWTLHLLLAWAVSEFACTAGARGSWLGVHGVTWAIGAISTVMLALSVSSTLYAARLPQRAGPPTAPELDDAVYSLARMGWWLGILFSLTIVAQTLPLAWFLRGC